ncbi:uncharacterized protein [Bombus fervidus]|uniref:uncharacterized protein n=1 Tax=Bombus fervidus TaxID=203811 RepID=UPI003AB2EC9E
MEKSNAGMSTHSTTRSKRTIQCELQRLSDHNEIKDMLTNKLSEMNTLHETIIEEQNYLVEENKQLNQELSKLKEEYVKAIVIKDKEINGLKREIGKHCKRLEHGIDEVESTVMKSGEIEIQNREILQRDEELNKQLCEFQERLATKDKIIKMKAKMIQMKKRDVYLLKEKTEQLLQIYEKSMREKLRNISNMCTEICNQSPSTTQNKKEEAESSV